MNKNNIDMRRYGLNSCKLSRCKRESGSNPEQPPLLYLTGKSTDTIGFFSEKVCFKMIIIIVS